MSFLKKLASQTAIYGLGSIVGRGMYLLMTPLLTAAFAPGTYGVFSNCYSYVALMLVVLTFGMETTFFRFREEHGGRTAYNASFWTVALLATAVAAPCLIFYPAVASLMGIGEQPALAWMSVVILWLDAVTAMPMARLRQEEKAKLFTALSLGNTLVLLALNILFVAVLHKGIAWVFIANIIASALKLFAALPFARPDGFPLRKSAIMRPMWVYGFFVMLAGMAGMMNENLDKILIPKLWQDGALFHDTPRTGDELLGIYAACYKMSIFIALLTQAFRYAAEPFFFQEAGKSDSPEKFALVFHYFMLLCLAGALLVGSFAQEIVAFSFFGVGHFIDVRYWEGLEIVPVLLAAYVCSAAYTQVSIWFKITKQTRFALLFTGTGAALTIAICAFTIPRYGYIGCAWATLICYAVMATMAYVVGQRYYPIPYKMGRLGLYAAGLLLVWYANLQVGASDGEAWIFLLKTALCGLALGGIFVAERWAK